MVPTLTMKSFLLYFLFLTPIQSLIPKQALPTKSGYLPITTSSSSSSSLYFAFYEAQTPAFPLAQTPLLIWLQGGPGCSSMVGNLFELGPYLVSHQRHLPTPSLRPNPFSWNRRFGLLFIDNPIGTGFSIAATPDEIPRDQSRIAKHLFVALQSFLSSSDFRARPVYVTGESYAGKYVPAFGYHILQRNSQLPEHERVNLGGVAIGNGLTHPVAQVNTHALSAYYTGLINAKQREQLEALQVEAVRLTNQKNWSEATTARTHVLRGVQTV